MTWDERTRGRAYGDLRGQCSRGGGQFNNANSVNMMLLLLLLLGARKASSSSETTKKTKKKKKGTRSLIKIESERWKRTQTSTSLLETWYQCAYKKKGWAGTSVARQRLGKLLLSKPVIARTCNRLLGCCCLATDIITWWLGVDDRPSSKVRCFFSPFLLFFPSFS